MLTSWHHRNPSPELNEFLHRGELHALCWPHRRPVTAEQEICKSERMR